MAELKNSINYANQGPSGVPTHYRQESNGAADIK